MSEATRPSGRRKQARGARTRGAVLDAALAAFAEGDGASIAVEELCRRSGASVGSLYHHFGSKEGVAAALFEELLERYRAALRERLAGAVGARAMIETIVRHHLEWVVAHPVEARYLATMRRAPDLRADDARLRASTSAFLRELRARFRAVRGEIVELPLPLLHPIVVGPAEALTRQWLAGRLPEGYGPLEAADALAAAAWRAVARDPDVTGSSG